MIVRALFIVLTLPFLLNSAQAAQIRLLCPGALKGTIGSLSAEFERTTGQKVEVTFDIVDSIARRIRSGEPFDLAFETPTQWTALAADGKLDPSVRVNIANVRWALYVRKGSPKPRIETVEEVRQALLDAKSIAYSSVQGPIRAYQARVTEQLGLTEALKEKARFGRTPRPGEVGVTFELVMNGGAEIGFGTVSEILERPALEMVGPMPPALQSPISFVSVVPANAAEPAVAKRFIEFLTSPNARAALKRAGLEPD